MIDPPIRDEQEKKMRPRDAVLCSLCMRRNFGAFPFNTTSLMGIKYKMKGQYNFRRANIQIILKLRVLVKFWKVSVRAVASTRPNVSPPLPVGFGRVDDDDKSRGERIRASCGIGVDRGRRWQVGNGLMELELALRSDGSLEEKGKARDYHMLARGGGGGGGGAHMANTDLGHWI